MPRKDQNKFHFREVPEGQSVEAFEIAWYLTPFAQKVGPINTEKLYYQIEAWASAKEEKRVDWIAEARTFYLKSPQQYKIPFLNNGRAKLSKATEQFIIAASTADALIDAQGIDNFIPENLRNHGGGNNGAQGQRG